MLIRWVIMVIREFPPLELANQDGLLAIGGDLDIESLLLAYRSGIFPWPVHEDLLTWFAPPERCLLFLDRVHISRSLKKELKNSSYSFHINRDVPQIISSCAAVINRGEQQGTWITSEMVRAYIAFHQAGYCHGIGCYDDDALVGGLYGICIGKMFAGESMFYRKPNASKLALCYLITHLQEREVSWIDCQMMTPLLQSFGAVCIPRLEFMKLLKEALSCDTRIF